jgi:uncharacterized membrane protein YjgN (DUF898 family)
LGIGITCLVLALGCLVFALIKTPSVTPGPISFTGTGGEFFKKLFVGGLLCAVTLSIYVPWFIVSWKKYIYSRTQITGTSRGNLHISFSATGGKLFVLGLVQGLLCVVTLNIYAAWAVCKIKKFMYEHTHFTADDGTRYDLTYDLTGGALFKFAIINGLLCLVTGFIYMPWAVCKWQKLNASNTFILSEGRRIGTLNFSGSGLQLFLKGLVNYLLVIVTLGMWAFWMQINVGKRFFTNATQIQIGRSVWALNFHGTGAQWFKINFLGALLMPLTLMIYGFWFAAKLMKFEWGSLSFNKVS